MRVVVVLRVVVFGFRATSMAHYSVSSRVHTFSRRGPFPDDNKIKNKHETHILMNIFFFGTREWVHERVFSACVYLFPAFDGWCHVSRTGVLTHSDADIIKSSGASRQCAQPALAKWNLTEGCASRGQEGGGLHGRAHIVVETSEKS